MKTIYYITTRIKNSLFLEKIFNNLFLIVISVTLLLLSIYSIYFVLGILIYLIYLYKKDRYIFKISIVICTIVFIIYLLSIYDDKKYASTFTGKIIDVTYYEDYSKYIIKKGFRKVLLYDYDNYNLRVGDYVFIDGIKKEIESSHVPNAFDYSLYLKNKRIFYALELKEVVIEKRSISIGYIRQRLLNYFDKNYSKESSSFLKALLIGYSNSLDEEFYNSVKENGIVHLFAISGLHVTFFVSILTAGLSRLKIKDKMQKIIISIFLTLYMAITNFTPSIVRTSLMYFLSIILKKTKILSLDICSLSFLILILINPLYMYNVGFILSYLVSFSIVLTSSLIREKSEIAQVFIISLVSLIITFPISVNLNNKINLLTPIINILFIFLVTNIMLPLSIIVSIISPLDYIYKLLVKGFMNTSIFLNDSIGINIVFPTMTPILIFIYYVLIVSFLLVFNKRRRYFVLSLYILFLLFMANINLFNPKGKIYFLDLYYGESTVIFSPFKESVIVIDTGDGSSNALSSFLKSKGVKKIEALIITHGDFDHNGEVSNMIKEFKIKNMYISYYDDTEYNFNTTKIKANDIIELDRYIFSCLSPSLKENNINDNSLVLLTTINEKKILFTGDITTKIETILPNIKVDILKVAHHGSSTSTSSIFLERIEPEYAIIMNGRVKKFGFPSSKTIETLNMHNVITYTTKDNRTIIYEYTRKKEAFKSFNN